MAPSYFWVFVFGWRRLRERRNGGRIDRDGFCAAPKIVLLLGGQILPHDGSSCRFSSSCLLWKHESGRGGGRFILLLVLSYGLMLGSLVLLLALGLQLTFML